MNDEERYLFDLQGYLVVEGVLSPDKLKQMHADMTARGITAENNDPSKSRFGDFLGWGQVWHDLIDQPTIMPYLAELLGAKYRLDHAYGMAMNAKVKPGGEGLHHNAAMFYHGCYYVTHGLTMHNGLIAVSYALVDVPLGAGGFCCIPGSHKALYPIRPQGYPVTHDLVKHVTMKAGDVLIFTESLTHGTMPWTNTAEERRSVLLKYCPHYMQWAKDKLVCEAPALSERQKLILEGGYVWVRADIPQG